MPDGTARFREPRWNAPLRRLETAPAAPSHPPAEADLAPWRDRIDAIDEAVLALLNERAACAAEIGELKRALGMPVYVPEREEEVLANVLRANPGPLPAEAVRRLFERVIDETRSLERRLYAARERAAGPTGKVSDNAPR